SAGQSAGEIYPVVGAKCRMADAKLTGVAGIEAGENNLAHIGAPVAIGILQINEVGRAGDEQAAAPRHDAVREGEAVGKDSASVVMAIAVGIFEERDDSGGRLAGTGACGIASILHDKQSSQFIEDHGHWINDNWLGSD